ncbi:MAG: DOMON domain-containing protein [Candidatus Hodarchaeota archaeon]
MNSKKKFLITILFVLISLSFAGSVGFANTKRDILTKSGVTTPIVDGVISTAEYLSETSLASGDFQLYWQIEVDSIFFGMVGTTTGWLAVGFNPTTAMQNADMVFGWIFSNGSVITIDAFSTGPNGPHPADIDLGGTVDILSFNGTEGEEKTTIEFSRLLITGDQYDNDIPSSGEYDIIWALGNTDDFGLKHIKRGSATINIGGTNGSSKTGSSSSSSESTIGFPFMLILLSLIGVLFHRK